MIKIDRSKITKSEFFHSKEYERLQQEISEFYGQHKNSRAQQTFSVGYLPYEIIESIMQVFDYKCAFCESSLTETKMGYESYLHRFRPSSYTQGFDAKEIDQDHYWWLTYEWENLYACCHSCSRFKSNVFPLEGKRAALETPYEQISRKEKAFLVDPCLDNPDQYFEFNISTFEIIPKIQPIPDFLKMSNDFTSQIERNRQKAEATIKILGLNRQDLIYEREIILLETTKRFISLQKNSNNLSIIIKEWKEILEGNSKRSHLSYRKAVIIDFLNRKKTQSMFGSMMNEFDTYISSLEPEDGGETEGEGEGEGEDRPSHFKNFQQEIPDESPLQNEQIKGGDIFESLQFPLKEDPKTGSYKRNLKKLPTKSQAIFQEEDGEFYASILKNVYLDKIVLKNFKCFSDLTLKLPDYSEDTTSEPWLVFLGENGVGKSSVLKAIALALMGQKYLDTLKLEIDDLLKFGKRSGFIRVYGKGKGEFYEITYTKKDNKITSNKQHPSTFMIGYGSTRLLPLGNLEPEKNHPNYLKVKNLFDYSVSLSNAKDWFLNTNRKTFNEVSRSLKNLLLLDDLDSIGRSITNKQIFIKYHRTGDKINIDHLSDGYKSIFAMAIDMIHTLSKENVVYELAEGIVLIDEIGTHLHPRWKMEVIDRLRGTFPKIQFIITTHEPLCLRGIKQNEVVVLQRNEKNTIDAISDLPDPSSLRIDQLLTSEYFGLNSTMDIHTEKLFASYYELLAINESDRTEKDIAEIERLKKEVDDKNYMRFGNDLREELVYQTVDELIAQKMKKRNLKIDTSNIKQQTISKVQDLWNSIDINKKS